MGVRRQLGGEFHQVQIQRGVQSIHKAVAQLNPEWRLNYHFMPPANWMNDPNGLIYFQGKYHVFYQHNPHAVNWGPMYWGHATSTDMITWTHLPMALAPSEVYDYHPDGGGCYSGSAIDDNGTLTLIYTGRVVGENPSSGQCLATSDDGIYFEKHSENPVILGPPISGLKGFRDPKVWKHGEYWYMVVGSGRGDKGLILFYRSPDLLDWQYLGIAAESDGSQGNMWECPDLFPLGDKHVLIFSPMGLERLKTMYFVGDLDYESGKFVAQSSGELDYGRDFYATQTFVDAKGNRVAMAWMESWDGKHPTKQHGWLGALTLPRTLTLGTHGQLKMKPVEALKKLRQNELVYADLDVFDHEALFLTKGDSLEVQFTLDLSTTTARSFRLYLRSSPSTREETALVINLVEGKVEVDTTLSGVGDKGITSCNYKVTGEPLLRVGLYLDRSSLEVFVNDGEAVLTNRVYPKNDSLQVKALSIEGKTHLKILRIWELKNDSGARP